MSNTPLMTLEPVSPLTLQGDPELVLEQAHQVAKLLQGVVEKTGAFALISGRKHLKIEAWLTLGSWYGVLPRCLTTTHIELDGAVGYEADAVAVNSTGQVLSQAQAMCMSNEPLWGTRPKYEYDKDTGQSDYVGEEPVSDQHRRSMAQTRANAKVLSNVLRWVVVLAGYEPTPTEEMPEGPEAANDGRPPWEEPPKQAMPQPTENGARPRTNAGDVRINEKQERLVWARLRAAGKTPDHLREILTRRSYATVGAIKKGDLDAILAEIQGVPSSAA